MNVSETALPGVLLVEPVVHGDERGFFLESYHVQRYLEQGVGARFVQDNHSRSRQGVLRGLHFQRQHAQGKLVRVVRGAVFDVAVDTRHGSPTFGQWVGTVLDDKDHRQLYIPPGLAHGFCVLSDVADFAYKCTEYYYPQFDAAIRWDDPDVGIEWPCAEPVLSAKDANAPFLRDLGPQALPAYTG